MVRGLAPRRLVINDTVSIPVAIGGTKYNTVVRYRHSTEDI